MKEFTVTKYKCETCGAVYESVLDAKSCEKKQVTHDKGVKIGDTIRIVRGDGQGLAKVTGRFVYNKEWGHYAWKRYWHTVGLAADCLGEGAWGSRQLTFDDYDLVAVSTRSKA
jgi:hypothetical protein